jgi:hypothetical protein
MFTFMNFNRRYPNNSALSKYCMESTNKSIRKLTQEYDEERKKNQGILIKKYFNEHNNNNNNENNDTKRIIKIISVLSALHFALNFLFNPK